MGTPAKHGKKRKSTATPTKNAPSSTRKSRKIFEPLSIDRYRPKEVGTRVLSCGEGEQLGHPGRNVTRKPRAIDTFPDGVSFLQVAAGGVHSLVLTADGTVYSCGINEKGTVPVQGLEAEGSTDKFSEIDFAPELKRLGKIVQITAGASFSAALTEKGSVIAWGNLRDTQGEVNVHETLKDIQKKPVMVIRHKTKEHWHIVKIEAGENHLAMLSNEGELLTFGEGSMGQLGRTTRTEHIRSKFMVDSSGTSLILRVLEKHQFLRFVDVWARGFWTIGRAEDGRLFACGLNNFGQLGVLPPVKKAPIARGRRSGSRRKEGSQQAANSGKPATMETLNFDELDITALQAASSEDSSQEPEAGDSSANDDQLEEKKNVAEELGQNGDKKKKEEESPSKQKQQQDLSSGSLDLKLPPDSPMKQQKEQQQNGGVADVKMMDGGVGEESQTSSMLGEKTPTPNTSAASDKLGTSAKEEHEDDKGNEDDGSIEKAKIIGQEEANKVALLTWAQAFPSDKVWTHLSGVQHIVCRNENGELHAIGKNTDNALGLGTWEGNKDEKHWRYDSLQKVPVPEGVRVAGVNATLGASIFWSEQGKAYGFGCDTTGQLGLGIKDDEDKIVSVPRQIGSAHLDGFRVISVSLADNHALFLATPEAKPAAVEAHEEEMKEEGEEVTAAEDAAAAKEVQQQPKVEKGGKKKAVAKGQ